MTAVNHALFGAVIGLVSGNPAVAVPAALASHFLLDAVPHYGSAMPEERLFKTKLFRNYLLADAALCFALVVVLFLARPEHWLLAAFCAFVATSPDFAHIPRFILKRSDKKWRPNIYTRFASRIQWFQRPIGAVIEVVFFVCMLLVLAKLTSIW